MQSVVVALVWYIHSVRVYDQENKRRNEKKAKRKSVGTPTARAAAASAAKASSTDEPKISYVVWTCVGC